MWCSSNAVQVYIQVCLFSAILTLALWEFLFILNSQLQVECLCYKELIFYSLRFCIAGAIIYSLISLLHMLINVLYHWKGISLFFCTGIRNVDYDLSIMKSSYSITRLQRKKKSFRIYSKFLRIFLFS